MITQLAFFDDPARFTVKVNKLCGELEERVNKQKEVFPQGMPRILIAGTPQPFPSWKLHHIIETSGGSVVREETCTGTRYFDSLVDEEVSTLDGQLEALAARGLSINCSCFTPNDARVDDILRLAKEYEVDGVVYYNLQFCHPYSVEYYKVEKALRKVGIPVIQVESDFRSEDVGQLQTRIQAFLE